jgi:hypothetical protein
MTTEKPIEKEHPDPNEADGVVASVVSGSGRESLLKRHWKIFVSIGLLISLILAVALSQYYPNRDVYMVVGERKITKSQYNEAKLAHENYIKAVGGKEEGSVEEDPDFVKKQLIFITALDNEAVKAGINVTQAEIDASLAQSGGGSSENQESSKNDDRITSRADKVRSFQQDTYGWSTEYSNSRQRTALLQSKLKDKLLNQTDVFQVSLVLGEVSKLSMQSGKELLDGTISPILAAHKGSRPDLVKILGEKNQYLNAQLLLNVLNGNEYPDLSEEAKSAINKLDTPGQVSEVVKTEENVLQIFRLESITKGEYSSWDDFTKKQMEKTEFINSWFDWRRFTL